MLYTKKALGFGTGCFLTPLRGLPRRDASHEHLPEVAGAAKVAGLGQALDLTGPGPPCAPCVTIPKRNRTARNRWRRGNVGCESAQRGQGRSMLMVSALGIAVEP